MALKNMKSKNENERNKLEMRIALFRTAALGLIFLGSIVYMFAKPDISCIVHGQSMYPTFSEGDEVVVQKVKDTSEILRYDIVAVNTHRKYQNNLIKRVVGLPEETIRISKTGKVYVNDQEMVDCYGYWSEPMLATEELVVELKEDEFFVLGDNINNSTDSREKEIGAIHMKDILGVVKE